MQYNPEALDYERRWDVNIDANCGIQVDWYNPVDPVLYDVYAHVWRGRTIVDPWDKTTVTNVTYAPLNRCVDIVDHYPIDQYGDQWWKLMDFERQEPIDDGCGVHSYSRWRDHSGVTYWMDLFVGPELHGDGNIECIAYTIDSRGDKIYRPAKCSMTVKAEVDWPGTPSQVLPTVPPGDVEQFEIVH